MFNQRNLFHWIPGQVNSLTLSLNMQEAILVHEFRICKSHSTSATESLSQQPRNGFGRTAFIGESKTLTNHTVLWIYFRIEVNYQNTPSVQYLVKELSNGFLLKTNIAGLVQYITIMYSDQLLDSKSIVPNQQLAERSGNHWSDW